jgi:hypothetical protein
MSDAAEISVIVETHTFNEGGARERLRAVLQAVSRLGGGGLAVEVLLADVCRAPELAAGFPKVRRVDAAGLGYDGAKLKAAAEARGRYVLFLDGDCLPAPGWLERHLAALRSGQASAVGGFTRYQGGFLAAVMSAMDFGFLLPRRARSLKCYACNNCGFLRETLERVPIPSGYVRCRCFYHAQRLARLGTPMLLVPEAAVLHEMQPIVRERSRQGYDLIAACWTDPELEQARWLRWGLLCVPVFYAAALLTDAWRLWIGRADLSLRPWQLLLALPTAAGLRLIDAAGMVRAIRRGPEPGGWGGWLLTQRYTPQPCSPTSS